uniref:Hepatic nuclear factor 4, beta n=1 Tax=Nothobranchius furzeri TaxID=105023 RepID=A0A8C6VTV9_NOTFU
MKPFYPQGYRPESAPSPSVSQTDAGGSLCCICADNATGKHCGASSCDACKGFLRRSIRNNHTYNCRFNRQCVVDKDKRNQGRFCRLTKSSVQDERDTLSFPRAKGQTAGPPNIELILMLFQIPALPSPQSHVSSKKRTCVGDVFQSMKQQLLLLVERAKHIPEFCHLQTDDSVTLLQTHSAEHLILGAARRSLPYLQKCDSSRGAELEVLVKPLRELGITDKKLACLQAIAFLAPGQSTFKSFYLAQLLSLFLSIRLSRAGEPSDNPTLATEPCTCRKPRNSL